MPESELQAHIIKAIRSVAPEADFAALDPYRPWREQMDIDSMDFLNILVRVQEKLGVDVPETDYQKISTLNSFVTYLQSKM